MDELILQEFCWCDSPIVKYHPVFKKMIGKELIDPKDVDEYLESLEEE